jgi:hypothetical protein
MIPHYQGSFGTSTLKRTPMLGVQKKDIPQQRRYIPIIIIKQIS